MQLLDVIRTIGIEGIANEDEKVLSHLRNHLPEGHLSSGRTYLSALTGVLFNKVLDSVERLSKKEGNGVYENAIKSAGEEAWQLVIRLECNDSLPQTKDLEFLLESGVRQSCVLSAKGEFGDYPTIASQTRLIYTAIDSPRKVRKVRDTSLELLKRSAMITTKEAVQCNSNQSAVQGLSGIAGKIIMGIEQIIGIENAEHLHLKREDQDDRPDNDCDERFRLN